MNGLKSDLNQKKHAENDSLFFDNLRAKEYALLDAKKQIYLDYTGGNLCPKTLLTKQYELLSENVLGNPHSTNPTSALSTKLAEQARSAVIDFFNASDYHCIFTANASGALKIIGESYPFNHDSNFIILSDNHNSVNGIREFCKNKGGSVKYAKIHYEDLTLDENYPKPWFVSHEPYTINLLLFNLFQYH